jgi:hypothetical protein
LSLVVHHLQSPLAHSASSISGTQSNREAHSSNVLRSLRAWMVLILSTATKLVLMLVIAQRFCV